MKTYDSIVVGSGITGLTAARILSQHGKTVLLLEKAKVLGGSLARFKLKGIPFDVGFHFTGGFTDNRDGVLDNMLSVLGVRDQIKPLFYPRDVCHRMIFPTINAVFSAPCGIDNLREKMKSDFPQYRAGIDKYFDRVDIVIKGTPTLEVSGFDDFPPPLEEDHVTLQAVLDDCVNDPLIQTILGGLCMCYGTRPDEVSFAAHARVCYGLQESLARVDEGGQAFVDAFVSALERDGVEIRTNVTIAQCADVVDRKVGRYVLTDGTEVSSASTVFTIDPRSILEILPKEHLSKAFKSRVEDFEPSLAFFTLFGTINRPMETEVETMISVLPGLDLNSMLTAHSPEPVDGPLLVLRNLEHGRAEGMQIVTALEVAFPETTDQWKDTFLRRRPAEYYRYKDQRSKSIMDRMDQHIPECRGMTLIDSSSTLSYRDYLNSPEGSAYGIKQKMGQFNVAGKLPLANLYAAGQCALLPGVIGAMTSAFFVCRSILGRDTFKQYLTGKSCSSTVQS